jgi:hypothetical protein
LKLIWRRRPEKREFLACSKDGSLHSPREIRRGIRRKAKDSSRPHLVYRKKEFADPKCNELAELFNCTQVRAFVGERDAKAEEVREDTYMATLDYGGFRKVVSLAVNPFLSLRSYQFGPSDNRDFGKTVILGKVFHECIFRKITPTQLHRPIKINLSRQFTRG